MLNPIPFHPRAAPGWPQFSGLVAFYFPGHLEPWDSHCGASFLGNFYPSAVHLGGHTFQTAEAAFQALKFWGHVREFEKCATGNDAFLLKDELEKVGQADHKYHGLGNNWNAMLAVLHEKFKPGTSRATALLQTGTAFLLEHNSVVGRDEYWSDDGMGTGRNWLGLQLMILREELSGARGALCHLHQLVDQGALIDNLSLAPGPLVACSYLFLLFTCARVGEVNQA